MENDIEGLIQSNGKVPKVRISLKLRTKRLYNQNIYMLSYKEIYVILILMKIFMRIEQFFDEKF